MAGTIPSSWGGLPPGTPPPTPQVPSSAIGTILSNPQVQSALATGFQKGVSAIGTGTGGRRARRQLRRVGKQLAKAQGLRGRAKRQFIANYISQNYMTAIQQPDTISPGGVSPAQQGAQIRGGVSFGQQPLGNFIIIGLVILASVFLFRKK